MKINLLYGHGDFLQSHLNINPFSLEETESMKIGDIRNLDGWVDDAEATEIIAMDVIDYFSLAEVNPILDHWISKLRHGGKIVIGGCDALDAAKALSQYELDLQTFNMLIHGTQDQPHLYKKTTLTLIGIVEYFREHGLKIIKQRKHGINYVVEAKRP